MTSRRSYGIGLLETLVTMGLGLLLLSLLHRFFVPVLQANSRNSVETHFVQQANLSLNRLVRDLKQSSAAGVSYRAEGTYSDASVLAINGLDGVSSQGRTVYQDNLSVYHFKPSEKTLYWMPWPPSPPSLTVSFESSRPTRLDFNQLGSFLQPQVRGKVLAQNVEEFQALDTWPPGSVVTSRIRFSKDVSGKRAPISFEHEIKTVFRN